MGRQAVATIVGVAIFALVFIVLPLVEIYVAVQVGHVDRRARHHRALAVALARAASGSRSTPGFGVIARIRRQLEAGRMPTNELIDGGLVLAGGVLLIVPGFVTGAVGLLLLFPPTRVARAEQRQAPVPRPRHRIRRAEFAAIGDRPPRRPDDIIDI